MNEKRRDYPLCHAICARGVVTAIEKFYPKITQYISPNSQKWEEDVEMFPVEIICAYQLFLPLYGA